MKINLKTELIEQVRQMENPYTKMHPSKQIHHLSCELSITELLAKGVANAYMHALLRHIERNRIGQKYRHLSQCIPSKRQARVTEYFR